MRIFTIGRKDTDIVLPDPNKDVSRLHAELTVTDDGRFYLADCGSSNGTSIRRTKPGQPAAWEEIKQEYVTEQDAVKFGSCETTVRQLLRMTAPAAAPVASAAHASAEPLSRNLVARRHPETGAIIWEPDKKF